MDYTCCSLPIAKNVVSDSVIETAFISQVARTAKSLESVCAVAYRSPLVIACH